MLWSHAVTWHFPRPRAQNLLVTSLFNSSVRVSGYLPMSKSLLWASAPQFLLVKSAASSSRSCATLVWRLALIGAGTCWPYLFWGRSSFLLIHPIFLFVKVASRVSLSFKQSSSPNSSSSNSPFPVPLGMPHYSHLPIVFSQSSHRFWVFDPLPTPRSTSFPKDYKPLVRSDRSMFPTSLGPCSTVL